MARLAVNVDHTATIRQSRENVSYPDPVAAAILAELAGASGIVVHLREDRRHIQERDVKILREVVQTRLILEMAATPEMVGMALGIQPDVVTLVPEKREELTEALLTHTTSLGVRSYEVDKTMLQREFSKLETSYGEVTIKTAMSGFILIRFSRVVNPSITGISISVTVTIVLIGICHINTVALIIGNSITIYISLVSIGNCRTVINDIRNTVSI